jgi:hypothetical protein
MTRLTQICDGSSGNGYDMSYNTPLRSSSQYSITSRGSGRVSLWKVRLVPCSQRDLCTPHRRGHVAVARPIS